MFLVRSLANRIAVDACSNIFWFGREGAGNSPEIGVDRRDDIVPTICPSATSVRCLS